MFSNISITVSNGLKTAGLLLHKRIVFRQCTMFSISLSVNHNNCFRARQRTRAPLVFIVVICDTEDLNFFTFLHFYIFLLTAMPPKRAKEAPPKASFSYNPFRRGVIRQWQEIRGKPGGDLGFSKHKSLSNFLHLVLTT